MNNLNNIVDYLKVFNNIETYKKPEPRTMAQEPRMGLDDGGRIGFLKGKRVKDKIFKYPYSNQHGTFYSDKPVFMDRTKNREYKINKPTKKQLKIAETKYSKRFGNKKGFNLWKAMGGPKRSSIVEGHVTGGTSGVPGGKIKKNMLSKDDFIKLVKSNKDKTYNEFVEIIKKYKTKDGGLFTKSIVADRVSEYNLSGFFKKEPPKRSSSATAALAEKTRRDRLIKTDPTRAKGTVKFPFHHIRQIGGDVPLTTDDIAIIKQRMNAVISQYNEPLNRIADSISKNHKLALEAMNAKNEGLALDYMKRVNELNESAEKIVNSAIKKLPKEYKNLIGFNQFTLPTNEYGLPIQNEPLIVKKIGGAPVTKGAIPLTDLTREQEKALRTQIKADAKAGKNINQKKFLNTFSKTFQDLSPRSIVQMAEEFDCTGTAKGGNMVQCLKGKFNKAPEKFLQRSAPLAKNNVNLFKWFKNGRKIARGTGVFLAWEAALAPVIAGWAALEGESGARMINEIAYGIPFIGETEKEEWMREAGGDELAYKMKKMGELEEQELPYLQQQLNDVINKTANVEGKGYQQRLIEKDIEEKKLELQEIYNTPEFYEGPAGGASAEGDYGYNEPVIQGAFDLEQQTTAKIAADKAERKKQRFDWLEENKIYADQNWQSQVSRADGGIMNLKNKW